MRGIAFKDICELNTDETVLIDIRTPSERKLGDIPGAYIVEECVLMETAERFRDRKIIMICHKGSRSAAAAEMLRDKGFEATSVEGGYLSHLLEIPGTEELASIEQKAARSLHDRYKKTLWSLFIKAIKTYRLVEEGDSIAVCISGGKDSMLMAKLFSEYHKYADDRFEIRYIVMDPGYAPENRALIENNARKLDIPAEFFDSRIFESVEHIDKSPCYLCARMRRGHLYSYAKSIGCSKIALGHHYDDVIETILMGMLYGGQMQSMIPKLHSTNFEGMELIRPMYFIREDTIKSWRDYNDLHFLQCACRFTDTYSLENGNESGSKRLEIKELIKELKRTNPFVEQNIFKSSENVNLDTLLAYKTKNVKHDFLEDY